MKRIVAIALLVVVGLTACGEKAKPSKYGGTLKVGSISKIVVNPWDAQSVDQLSLISQLYGTLTNVDANGVVTPGLAASWKASDDKRQWDFTLAEAKFSNGMAITASDVKASLEKTTAKDSKSPSSSVLQLVTGFIAFHTQGTATELTGVQVVDEKTVRILLDEPWVDLPTSLSSPAFGIAPAKVGTGLPVTSGLYTVIEQTPEKLEADLRTSKSSLMEKLEWSYFEDEEEFALAAQRGSLDIALGSSGGERVENYLYAGTLFYGLNESAVVLADIRVRQAVLHAIDRHGIVKEIYGTENKFIDGVVAEGLPGYRADACSDMCKYDVKLAKESLAQIDLNTLPVLHIDIDSTATQKKIANKMRADLVAVGLKAEVRVHTAKEYPEFLQSGKHELFQIGRVPEYLSADAVVWPLFSSGSADNVFGFHDAGVDELLQKARSTDDLTQRSQLFGDIEITALKQGIVVPLAQVRRSVGLSDRVHGFQLGLMGTFDVSKLYFQNKPSE